MRDGAGQNREAAAVVAVVVGMVGGWWCRRRRKVVAKRRESTRLRARIPLSICQLSVHTPQLCGENFQGVLSCFGFFSREITLFSCCRCLATPPEQYRSRLVLTGMDGLMLVVKKVDISCQSPCDMNSITACLHTPDDILKAATQALRNRGSDSE